MRSLISLMLSMALLSPGPLVWASPSAQEALQERVWSLPEEELIIFSPEQPRFEVTVFTDVNCPFCRELHRHIEDFMIWDIRIRYAAFPTIGNALEQMEAVWCSENHHDAMTRAKRGEIVEAPACENPVADHLDLALSAGFFGTPAIVTPAGQVLYGRTSAASLVEVLKREAR
ncbi:Thiol:disulfide interchange protein DsbC [Thioalkalivibrio nitratireducens DSM 14787]|uniref:Thiol:disulfide interchange protein n=1 Tax=Thioalkalivibrio nitratireducens (strain DSM 14787 / UNIQEM 213 / ALEN2) TaxID=1255043 RepID=L0DW29_THIND|nr:DsbC family protein [Thioalkalivibrio nitratireducens]AGA33222.1 Thiol:disulfide interchange protein DsbC [Thioalkalivibrio nitratireducens DSM 14787]